MQGLEAPRREQALVHVLLVDDDPFILEVLPSILAGTLGQDGRSVSVARSPAEAEAWVAGAPPGPLVVVSDYNLQAPRNGIHVLEAVRRLRPDAVRILMSGHARAEVPGLRDTFVHGFLEKPFQLEDLAAPFGDLVAGLRPARPVAVATATPMAAGPAPVPPAPSHRDAPVRLGRAEVVPALVKAEFKGERERARRLYEQAGLHGDGDAAVQAVARALAWQNRVLAGIATGLPLAETLRTLALELEQQLPGSLVSILLAKPDGRTLTNGASPSFPADFVAAIEGATIDPGVGPCALAAYQRERVVVADLASSNLWDGFRGLTAQHGLRAVWSTPVQSSQSKLLGTLAVYHRTPRQPQDGDLLYVDLAVGLARVAIEAHQDRVGLRHAEARLRTLVDATAQALWTTDPEGKVVEDSPSWRRMTGQTLQEWLGFGWLEAIHPDDRARVREQWLAAMADPKPVAIPYRVRRADGTYTPVLARGAPLLDAEGRLQEWVGMDIDVSAEHEAQQAVQRARESERLALAQAEAERNLLRQIFERSPSMVAFLRGPEHVYEFVNQASESVVRMRAEQIVGRRVVDVFPNLREDGFIALLDKVYSTGQPFVGRAVPMRVNGQSRVFDFTYEPIRDAAGNVTGIAAHGVLVPESGQAAPTGQEAPQPTAHAAALEGEVAHRTAALAQANRDLEAFAAAVSHDLRAPLRTLDHLMATALRRIPPGQPGLQSDLERARRTTHAMADLVDALLTLARAGHEPLASQDVDLSALAQEVVAHMRLLHPGRAVVADIAPGLHAQGDPRLLRAVLENLLGNAWKYTASRPLAHVSLQAEGEGASRVFRVRDDGVGFDADAADRLFAPFVRLDSTHAGLGLGLATVRRIVERHGGAVWAHGEPGAGATFSFTLPGTAAAHATDP